MRRALALTDNQLRLVERAARSLPLERRDEFLRDVAARLGEAPTTAAIEAAIGAFFERTPVFLCDSAPAANKETEP
jgi:hypothetical protein